MSQTDQRDDLPWVWVLYAALLVVVVGVVLALIRLAIWAWPS